MSVFDLFMMANKNLWRRSTRAMLTILGVVIGTASIITMVSLGIGLNESQRANMERWGSLNIVQINPSQSVDSEGNPLEGVPVLNDETLALLETISGVTALSPALQVNGEATWQRETGRLSVIGLEVGQLAELEFAVAYGEMLAPEDDMKIMVGAEVINLFAGDARTQRGAQGGNFPGAAAGRNIGQADLNRMIGVQPQMRPGQNAFGGGAAGDAAEADPQQLLGEKITLTLTNGRQETRNFHFMVVGVLDDSDRTRAWQVFASLEDMERLNRFMQRSHNRRDSLNEERTYNYILMRTADVGRATVLVNELREAGYNASTMAEMLEGIEDTTRMIQAVLGGIGSVALLVAALGITNTMVMSIFERTKEIGIIKVIGATNGNVSSIFLTEAAIIGLLGGIFGIVLSYGASAIINRFGGSFINMGMGGAGTNISVIPLWLALFAIVFAMTIGLLAGVLPAKKAVKLSPIDAIRQN